MKLHKILSTLGILCFLYLNAFSQPEVKKESTDKDLSLFRQFFQIFPLKNETTTVDLNKKLQKFQDIEITPIGFGGDLHWWIFSGENIIIDANILSYENHIVMVKATIYQRYIHRLKSILNQDITIQNKFNQLFALKTNVKYFNDSIYQYTYTNQPLLVEFDNHISEFLGKQSNINFDDCRFEYELINNPTERYQYVPSDSYNNYPPDNAINKLQKENRFDCLLNIIKGPSLYGRIYAIEGLLISAHNGKYTLSEDDKKLIKTVLNLNLRIDDGSRHPKANLQYNSCFDKELLKVLDDNFKFKEGNIYPIEERPLGPVEQNPEFKGGFEAMLKFLKANIKYPVEAWSAGIQGTVFVQFVVSETGKISNVKLLRGIGGGCDEESVRVVSLMPDWIPGRLMGKAVKVMFQIPVKFSIPIIKAY